MSDGHQEFRYAHIHGFSSDANSTKGRFLEERFREYGVDLALPELNQPSFEEITFGNALGAIDAMDQNHGGGKGRWRISASSMGAYLVALWAQKCPDKVDRLVLMCPAFGLGDRFADLVGIEGMAKWERDGELALPGPDDLPRLVHWRLVEEARDYPTHPQVPCPTVIIHGSDDETIPLESSRQYATGRDQVRLVEVDDDHSLEGSMDQLWSEVRAHFEIGSDA